MPQVHYPFIDVAVHPAVRTRFAAGDAVVLFSRDLSDVLWANGEGARLFGHGAIYDMIEVGPERAGVAFRQLQGAAAQLVTTGDKRGFMMRITSGFRSTAVHAEVNLIVVGREQAIMFSAPAAVQKRDLTSLLSGFDDPDTHMALLATDGEVLAASPGYAHVGVMPETMRALITAVTRSADGLVKRPIPSASGYLPAAIGRLADDLFLLFCVETSIGRMDAPESDLQPAEPVAATSETGDIIHSLALSDVAHAGRDVPESDNADELGGVVDEALAMAALPEVDSLSQVDPDGNAEETAATDVEEGESDADLGDLAALDGASTEEVEAASSNAGSNGATTGDVVESPGIVIDHGMSTELDADIAAASAEEESASVTDFETPEPVEAAAEEATLDVFDAAATEVEKSATVDHGQPTELDADIAESSAEVMPAAAQQDARDEGIVPMQAEETVADVSGESEPVATQVANEDLQEVEPVATEAYGAETRDTEFFPAEAPADASADVVHAQPIAFVTDGYAEQTVATSEGAEAEPEISDQPQVADVEAVQGHAEPTELDADIAEASEERMPSDLTQVETSDVPVELVEADVAAEEPGVERDRDAENDATLESKPFTVEAVADETQDTEQVQPIGFAADTDETVDIGAAASGDTDVEPEVSGALLNAHDEPAPDHAEPTELDADIAEASEESLPADLTDVEESDVRAEMGETGAIAADTAEDGRHDDDVVEAETGLADEQHADATEHYEQVHADGAKEDAATAQDADAVIVEAPAVLGETTASPPQNGTEEEEPLEVAELESSEAEADQAVGSLDVAEAQVIMSATTTSGAEVVFEPSAEESEQAWDDNAVAGDTPAAALDAEIAAQAAEAAHIEPPFRFDRGARPIRFVWKLDASGVFAEVSDEFARAVGPHAGDIVGQSFRELSALFGLDPEGQIASLLDRRDTWSGRTVKWPVEGTDLAVPVDLAALPTYSRNREFDGFRGFGIIRVGDAETDLNASGLKIAAAAAQSDMSEETAELDQAADISAPEPTDEFQGEVPALDIVSNPLASFADKVIQLEERRSRALRDGLSPSEQAALKEIARQLEPFGKRPNEDILKTSSGLLQTEESEDETDARMQEAFAHDGDAEVNATEEDDGDALEGIEASLPALDEQRMQNLFEDLGNGPGLTPYAIDQVPMAILIHAGDRLIEMNAEFRRLTGYAGIADLDRVGGLDALITRREGPDAGVYLVRADGTQVLVSARLQSVRYEGSSALMLALTPAVGTLAVAAAEPQMIVESEPARQIAALQIEVEELRSILETATDGVIVLDTEGRIRSMNRSAAALFNFDDAEILGKPFAMLFAHESQKSVQDYLAGLAGHGVASVLNDGREVIGREASGGFIPMFMTMGRMPGSNSYCAVIRDITQWKRSEEELRTAKRAAETANQHKSDFLARVSHEIRTPLNAIIGFADMIATEHFGPAGHPRYAEYASDIGRSGRHVLDIVNDLLDISKIEAGEMDLEFVAVGLNDCVSEAVSLVQPQANAQRVIIRTALSQAVPDVVADLRSIKQIALNILANAIRYTPSGGQIVVSTSYEPTGSVTLRIRDTGVGMSKAELEQAMKPFGQVAPGTRQRGDGTGLGLPLTKAMTEANRATFAIHSAPNEGTLVEISFPPQRVLAD
jgi:PAS domain S-box-containing protein